MTMMMTTTRMMMRMRMRRVASRLEAKRSHLTFDLLILISISIMNRPFFSKVPERSPKKDGSLANRGEGDRWDVWPKKKLFFSAPSVRATILTKIYKTNV